jgi:crotonobetaine/carnitine-CoA ligase
MTAAYHELITTLIVGGRIVFRRRFSFTRFWPDVRECGATHLTLIGIVARLLETAPPDDRDRDNPLKVMTGGPLPADRAAFEERFGVVTVACYGGTDVGMPTYERIGDGDPPDSHGVVQGIFEVRIADDNDEQLHVGEVGEILVRPRLPHVTSSGYFGMPQATVDTWRDLWFHTGDLGRFDAAGRLYFLGRKKEMIRRSGENISIFEVEEALIAHPAIAEAAVIAVPAELGEDEIVAFVSLKDGAELDEAELRAFCNANMGRFMVPQYIRFLAEIPRTPTGKYAMSALQAIFTSQ